MLTRRLALAATFALAALAPAILSPAFAGDEKPFTQAAFDAAMAAKKPVLVEIHADWCPTCKAQAPIIKSLTNDARFSGMTVLRVDFDAQKDVVRKFGAQQQSTLIVFKGGAEAGRSVGETSLAPITALLGKAI